MLGYNQEYFHYNKLIGYRLGLPTNTMWELDTAPIAGQKTGGSAYEWALQSLFGRVNYDYKSRYLLEANFRYDGSSRFHKDNRWGFFPSFSAGWRISEEAFLKDMDWLSNLKIRGSWGQLGNQNIGNYPYQDLLATAVHNFNGTVEQGVTKKTLNTPDIKWETTTAVDLGVDFDFFNSKIYGSIDWHKKTTKDILRRLQVPDHIGLEAPWVNDGEMENKGWEFVLGHQNSIGGFRYSISANLDTYKNKLLKYGAREIGTGIVKEEGLPWNTFYMYLFDGIYQNQAEIDNGPTPITGTQPGDMKYKDISGPDGVPDGKIDAYDRVTVDEAFPKFNYGFNVNMEYKNFDLSLFFQGVYGRKIYVKEWGIAPFRQSAPPSVFWRDAWDGEGTSNTIPHIFNDNYAPNTQVSDWWLQDASYLRLKNLQFGYTVPKVQTLKLGVQNLRVYFSADNLVTFTKFFQGLDPERTTSSNARAAIYPQNRVLTFGVKVTL
ncbi:MAG: SusC/RagA family TonB-linked outer membrane protein [Bacteroides sp.]|nr:SusC/RagA family TonB-linked outer membrane protein [Bacteroides sp.]